MRLLLINPKFPESFWSFTWAIEQVLPRKSTTCPPLGLATLAALCPPAWDVRIIDENVEQVPLAPDADIIGVCGMGVQFPRQRELLAHYRGRGYYTVAGGSYASLCNEKYAPIADTVVAGEAEYRARPFLRAREVSAQLCSLDALVARHRRVRRAVAAVRGAFRGGQHRNDYEPASRQLIVDYLKANNIEASLARHVKPRSPFRSRKMTELDRAEFAALNDIEDVSRLVRRIERDSKGVPILLKQYLKLGGRLLAFSADNQFNDALDGLIMVDLRTSEPRVLARYMGDNGAAGFLRPSRQQPGRAAPGLLEGTPPQTRPAGACGARYLWLGFKLTFVRLFSSPRLHTVSSGRPSWNRTS